MLNTIYEVVDCHSDVDCDEFKILYTWNLEATTK